MEEIMQNANCKEITFSFWRMVRYQLEGIISLSNFSEETAAESELRAQNFRCCIKIDVRSEITTKNGETARTTSADDFDAGNGFCFCPMIK